MECALGPSMVHEVTSCDYVLSGPRNVGMSPICNEKKTFQVRDRALR